MYGNVARNVVTVRRRPPRSGLGSMDKVFTLSPCFVFLVLVEGLISHKTSGLQRFNSMVI